MRVAVLAGRRVSADAGAFPRSRVPDVRARLRRLLVEERVESLICSGADGADLIALDLAMELDIARHIVLTGEVDDFRARSVAPEWQWLFDRVVSSSPIETASAGSDDALYRGVTRRLLELATVTAAPEPALALVVWDGPKASTFDHTANFAGLAEVWGMTIRHIPIRPADAVTEYA